MILKPLGYARLTVGIAAKPLANVPAGASRAFLKVETASIRMRDDGGTPTATEGLLLQTTDQLFEYAGDISAIRVIQATGVAGSLRTIYYA